MTYHYHVRYPKPPFKCLVMAFLLGLLDDNPSRVMWIFICAMTNIHLIFWLKDFARTPRPFWIISVSGPIQERSYSFPSGHTADITSSFILNACYVNTTWMWLVSFFLIIFMGFTRIAKAVHWPTDVIGSMLISLPLALLM